jgi:hypothetical protein
MVSNPVRGYSDVGAMYEAADPADLKSLISKADSFALRNIDRVSENSATQQMLQPTMPLHIHPASYSLTEKEAEAYYRQTLEGYTHAMQAYTQSQIWPIVGLDEHDGTRSRDSSDITISGVLHRQRPGPPDTAKTEGAE